MGAIRSLLHVSPYLAERGFSISQARMEAAMRGGELETVALTLPAVCLLVMEGVTFGKQLREAECNADLRFGLQQL
jgi:hypothetical protein